MTLSHLRATWGSAVPTGVPLAIELPSGMWLLVEGINPPTYTLEREFKG